jgi:hypothetical protein
MCGYLKGQLEGSGRVVILVCNICVYLHLSLFLRMRLESQGNKEVYVKEVCVPAYVGTGRSVCVSVCLSD